MIDIVIAKLSERLNGKFLTYARLNRVIASLGYLVFASSQPLEIGEIINRAFLGTSPINHSIRIIQSTDIEDWNNACLICGVSQTTNAPYFYRVVYAE